MNILDLIKQKDKQKHFNSGLVLSLVFALIFVNYYPIAWAIGVALFAGLLKDIVWDKWMEQGNFEWWDIVFTAAGAIPTVIILLLV